MPSIEDLIARYGAQENTNGGIFIHGATYGYEKRLEVAAAYHCGLDQNPPVKISTIARECNLGQRFVDKIINELSVDGMVLHPTEIEHKKRCTKISGFAVTVVLCLCMEDPSRSKCSYRNLLFLYTGIYVCELTIRNFVLHALPFRGSMVKQNLVPRDKFHPKNVADIMKFTEFIIHERPRNIKFGDKMNLKG
jgi:hypothetical protein